MLAGTGQALEAVVVIADCARRRADALLQLAQQRLAEAGEDRRVRELPSHAKPRSERRSKESGTLAWIAVYVHPSSFTSLFSLFLGSNSLISLPSRRSRIKS